MKKIALVMLLGTMLAGCDSMTKKFGEQVREVEVGDSLVSDGWNTVIYQQESDVSGLDFDSSEPELYVNIQDVETGSTFKVSMGSECSQFPAPKGQRMLIRFDLSKSKAKPNDIYMAPHSDQIFKILCP